MADFYEEIEVMQAESLKQLEKDIAAKTVKSLEEDANAFYERAKKFDTLLS